MIYITGDTHSELKRFTHKRFKEQKGLTKDDYVIIAGDFGCIWFPADDKEHQDQEHYVLDELNKRSFTTLFIPGNHENYDRLMGDEFPETEWHGGIVRQIRSSVLMLLRGEMYEINGKNFFAFGGASSHDITDGILDSADPDWYMKSKALERRGKIFYRVKGISWWPQELPSEEEMQHGLETLEKYAWHADYVITHCAPSGIQAQLGIHDDDCLTRYLEEIHQKLDYKQWFFAHYHNYECAKGKDIIYVNDKDIMLLEKMYRLPEDS